MKTLRWFFGEHVLCGLSVHLWFPEEKKEGKKGGLMPWSAFAKLLSSLCSCTLCHPQGERERERERQLISKHLLHSNSFIFGNTILRLQAPRVVDGAKTLSWAHYQLEGYHRTLAHQGDSNIGIATPGQTDPSSSPASRLRQ